MYQNNQCGIKKGSSSWFGGLMVALTFVAGCDFIPPNPSVSSTVSQSWVDQGRRCDWLRTDGKFLVPNLLELPFLDSIDRSALADRLQRASEGRLPPGASMDLQWPTGLNEHCSMLLRRFSEPFQVAETLMEVPASGVVKCLAFTPDAAKLVVVADRIELWDVSKKRLLHSIANNYRDVLAVFLHASSEHGFIVGRTEVVRVDLASGVETNQYRSAFGEICAADYASQAERLLVVGSQGTAWLLDDALKEVEVYADATATPRVAIDTGATEFYLAGNRAQVHAIRTDHSNSRNRLPMKPADADVQIEFEGGAHFHYSQERLQSPLDENYNVKWIGIRGLFGMEAFTRWSTTWVTCLRQLTIDDRPYTVAQDYLPNQALASTPTVFPDGQPTSHAICSLGELIALGYDGKVQVVKRRRWTYATHHDFAYSAANVGMAGNFAQWQMLVEAASSAGRTYDGTTGEELAFEMVYRLASWTQSATDTKLLLHLQTWWQSEEALPAFVAALHWAFIANRDSDRRAVALPETRKYIDMLSKLQPNSLAHLFMEFYYHLELTNDYPNAEKYLVKLTTNYPVFTVPHVYMSLSYGRRYPQNDQAEGAYCLQLAGIYPPEWQNRIQARIALEQVQIRRVLFSNATSLPKHLLPTFKEFVSTEHLTEVQLQQLLSYAAADTNRELRDAVLSYSVPIRAAIATESN